MQKAGDRDLSEFKSQWDNFSSSLSRSEQIKVIDATLGILNFDSGEDELNSGIAFLENMRDAGVTIGNQAIDSASGDPLGESFYTTKIDDLKEMAHEIRNKEKAEALSEANDYEISLQKRFREASKNKYSSDDPAVLDVLEKEEEYINALDVSDFEKEQRLKARDRAYVNGFKEDNDNIDEMEGIHNQSPSSPSQLNSQLENQLIKYVLYDLKGQKYEGQDVSLAVRAAKDSEGALDPSGEADITFFGIGPEMRNILNEKDRQFRNERSEAMEKVARLDAGEEITLGGKLYTIGADDNVKNKRNDIISDYMSNRMSEVMKEAKDELDGILAGEVKKRQDTNQATKDEEARLDKIEEERGLKEKSKEMLRVGSGTITTRRGERTRDAKRLQGSGIELQQELGGLGVAIGDFFNLEAETVVNMPKLYDSLEHTLRYNPNTPEETKIILEDVEALYDEAQPVIKGELRKAKDRLLGRGRTGVKDKPIFVQKYEELSNDVFRARRLFKGYTPEEVKKALSVSEGEPGYLPEGAIIKDPKSFFRNELLGEFEGATRIPKGGFKASALLKDMTDEQSVEIAKLLDVSPKILKQRQKDYRDYRSGVRKPVPEAKVTPKETPKESFVPKSAQPKARPPIRTTSEIEQEQLELNLDEPVKPEPTVETKITGTEGDITVYSPQRGGDKMEGGYPSSRPGPDGKALVRTVQDYANGTSEYITLAGSPSFYNKSYIIPELPYEDPNTGATKTLRNVRAVVHDTGGAFKTKPEFRYDIPYGRDLTNKQMTRYNGILKKKGIQFIDAVEPRDSEPLAADQPPSDDGELKGAGLLPRIN
jgi:hypothetical protein